MPALRTYKCTQCNHIQEEFDIEDQIHEETVCEKCGFKSVRSLELEYKSMSIIIPEHMRAGSDSTLNFSKKKKKFY